MLFDKRVNLKPYEYPDLMSYADAIEHSFWLHTEFNFTEDKQDYHTRVTPSEKNTIKNTMLAISQIEVSVKAFWGRLYDRIPKPEVAAVGYTFAESEVRHMRTYSHLLEELGLNDEFDRINEIPAIKDRVSYLERYLEGAKSRDNKAYAMSLLLFSIFTENVSLFSQFLIMMAFNKHRNIFRGVSNAVQATSKEEMTHGLFGIHLINIMREEYPDWFEEDMEYAIVRACRKAYKAEDKVLDWIFEQGELDFLSKATVQAFIQDRYNQSLIAIGIKPIFEPDQEELTKTAWFDEEIIATSHVDFFAKRPTSYAKKLAPVTEDDLF